MASLTSTLTVRLLDLVSGPATAASRALLGIGTAAAAANARGGILGPGIVTNLRAAEGALSRMATTMRSMSAISIPAGIAAIFGARQIYNFARAGNAFQAVTLATDAQRASVERLAQSLNALYPLNNTQIMNAATELARAGLTIAQVTGVLRGTLNLALAGDLGTAEAADIATNILTGMRLQMGTVEEAQASMTRVMDALSYAANRSNTTVAQLGETFKYVAPLASAFGMSVEQVTAASMVMANAGIRGPEAGVAMRSAIVRMIRPTREMLAALGRLNINITDFVRPGRQITAQDIVGSLQSGGINAGALSGEIGAALRDPALANNVAALTARLTDIASRAPGAGTMERTNLAGIISDALTAAGNEVDLIGFVRALRERGAAALAEMPRIFDQRQGARLITILMDDLDRIIADVIREAPGTAERMARQRMRGIVGAWDGFTASLENLAIRIGESGITNHIIAILGGLTTGLEALAALPDTTLVIGAWAVAVLALVPTLGAATLGVLALSRGLQFLAGATALSTAAAGAGTAGALATGAAGAGWLARGSAFARMAAGRLGLAGLGLAGLDYLDREGNLWGLTAPLDRLLNWNPRDISESQAEMNARLSGIQSRLELTAPGAGYTTGGTIPPTPPPEPGRLPSWDQMMASEHAIAAGQGAGQRTGDAFVAGIEGALEARLALAIRSAVESATAGLTISPSVRVTPQVDLGGIHADVGAGPR